MFGVGLSFGGSRAPMNDLIPATAEHHNEANMSVIDR
jgi:hypothetical protein